MVRGYSFITASILENSRFGFFITFLPNSKQRGQVKEELVIILKPTTSVVCAIHTSPPTGSRSSPYSGDVGKCSYMNLWEIFQIETLTFILQETKSVLFKASVVLKTLLRKIRLTGDNLFVKCSKISF